MSRPQRKFYLDNIKTFAILLLFPYHTFMIYNNFGEGFYIDGADLVATSVFLEISWLWMMPLLFTAAGISAAFSLKKRTVKEFATERVKKLLVPLIFGTLLLVPVQSYLAGVFHYGSWSYLNFFTQFTDLTGYDGAFTPGQLWFILYLFVISLVCIPIFYFYGRRKKPFAVEKIPLVVILLMGIIPAFGNGLLNISGKSPTEYLAYFLLGYFFLQNATVLQKLEKHRFWLLLIAAAGLFVYLFCSYEMAEFHSWSGTLCIIGFAKHHLNIDNRPLRYLANSLNL